MGGGKLPWTYVIKNIEQEGGMDGNRVLPIE
jgi:hypothetical protein